MANVVINDANLVAIGDAIRAKNGTANTYKPREMANAITNLPTGGGGIEHIILTGDQSYGCAGTLLSLIINDIPISTQDIYNGNRMFYYSAGPSVNFDINLAFSGNTTNNTTKLTGLFEECRFTTVPLVKGNLSPQTGFHEGAVYLDDMFKRAYRIMSIPTDYFTYFGGTEYWESTRIYAEERDSIFYGCYSLRHLPDLRIIKNKPTSVYSSLYSNLFTDCYALDEVINLPVLHTASLSSNMFSNTFSGTERLSRMVFEYNNGEVFSAPGWKSQTIDLSKSGCTSSSSYTHLTGYTEFNGGISMKERIADIDTYEALKDNPNCWTNVKNFSRYNHDSAVETINSLPDVSSSGGTNTIKFSGPMGSGYGKAISDLTEEELAVASAKGWTVTLTT